MNIKPIFALLIISLLANWASQPKKQGAQFFGTLTTEQGNTFAVKNITIGSDRKIESIPVYERPQRTESFAKQDENHITLHVNPKTELAVIYLDLDAMVQIKVPYPHTIWTYKQKEKGSREYEYLEIAISEKKCQSSTSTSSPTTEQPAPTIYLVEKSTNLYCDRIGTGKAEKMKVQLPAIKELVIEGYAYESAPEQNSCSPTTPPQKNIPQPQTTHPSPQTNSSQPSPVTSSTQPPLQTTSPDNPSSPASTSQIPTTLESTTPSTAPLDSTAPQEAILPTLENSPTAHLSQALTHKPLLLSRKTKTKKRMITKL